MNIAIVGCGIGGLTAATFLCRAGMNVILYDQFETVAPVGSGLVIQPVGLKVLEHLGIAQTVCAKGARGYHMLGYEAVTGRKVLDVSYGPKGGENFGLGIHRASLFDALLNCAKETGVTIKSGYRAERSEVPAQGRTLYFENGEIEGPFDLVIDASGATSKLSPMKPRELPYGAIWGTVDWPDDTTLAYDMLQQRYRRAHNMIGILPIGTLPHETTPKAALFWSLRQDRYDAWKNAPLDDWKSDATTLWPDLAPFIDQIKHHDDMTMARYTHGTHKTPYGVRIVYIGDAAHRASPQLGQGANMALLDAYALTQALQNHPLEKALRKYSKMRRNHTMLYQVMSHVFTPMYQSDSTLLPVLRDWILGPASTIPPAPTILTRLVRGTLIKPY